MCGFTLYFFVGQWNIYFKKIHFHLEGFFNAYHFSTTTTQKLAQELYEGLNIGGEHVGLITYIRTDSTALSDTYVYSTKEYIKNIQSSVDNLTQQYYGYSDAMSVTIKTTNDSEY